MPRPKKPGAGEPKKRSRTGCWPCKARKVKCGEEKPRCINCEKQGEACDYSIRLNWEGRMKKRPDNDNLELAGSLSASPPSSDFKRGATPVEDSPQLSSAPVFATYGTQTTAGHFRTMSATSAPRAVPEAFIDPNLEQYNLTARKRPAQFLADRQPSMNPELNLSSPQPRIGPDYPSPLPSSVTSPGQHDSRTPSDRSNVQSPSLSATMLPPIRSLAPFGPPSRLDVSTFSEPTPKRARLSPSFDKPNIHAAPKYQWKTESMERQSTQKIPADTPSPGYTFHSPRTIPTVNPLTPGSSATSEEYPSRTTFRPPIAQDTPSDIRRLSVQSLLSSNEVPTINTVSNLTYKYPLKDASKDDTVYGFDYGHEDYDLPHNDDTNAISLVSPKSMSDKSRYYQDGGGMFYGFAPQPKHTALERGGYYAQPVPIRIPATLEPLPARLTENPMNLLYFHHFLNHTARILVPHDCPGNPFRNVLPQMAVQNQNLLNLLLAFSASHRARLLNQAEPANRIAHWVQDVFPNLRNALSHKEEQISDANLATAIMLTSLEIISPNAFAIPISWQQHLQVAREIIIARGGSHAVQRRDKISYFLSRWFAYLDVLGSLSGTNNHQPLGTSYWTSDDLDGEDEFEIDCLLGFTSRCIGSLAQIAELARQCNTTRLDDAGNIRVDWQPTPEIIDRAEKLKRELQLGRDRVYRGCTHRSHDSSEHENEVGWDSLEIYATNEAFHWAGLIHLYRRILGMRKEDPEVQHAVREIVGILHKVRKGGTAETCLLFPIFTAGCEAIDFGQKGKILERLRSVEGVGMTQVHRARTLMEEVWATGKPWESLVSGEFFG